MANQNIFYIYILTNQKNGTLYIGKTTNLLRRINEHKNEKFEGFTKKYKIKNLVYFETFNSEKEALIREKRLKKWNRDWKIELIEKTNPEWKDLYNEILQLFSGFTN